MRAFSDLSRRALKAATAASFEMAGGVTLLSQVLGMAISSISKYASFNAEYSETFIRIDLAIEADRRAGSPLIVSAMARELGFRLTPAVDEAEGENADPTFGPKQILKLNSEMDDAIRELTLAIDDGRFDALERKRSLKEINEAIRALEQARDVLTEV